MGANLLSAVPPSAAGFFRLAAGSAASGEPVAVATLAAMPDTRERLDAYRLSFDDWLRLPEGDGLCEVIDGELFMSPAPNVGHQGVVRQFTLLLGGYLGKEGSARLFHAPTALRLGEKALQPDLMVLPPDTRRPAADAVAIEIVPLLVVEVLSPGTAHRDLGIKKEAYAAGGVGEYWIVDPVRATVDRLALAEEGYETTAVFGRGQVLTSPTFADLALPLDELFPPAAG